MSKTVIFFPKLEESKPYHHLPLSALSVAAPMVARGENVSIFDERTKDDFSGIKLKCYLVDADEIWFSVYTGYQLTRAYQVSVWVKENYPNIKIIWGGPHVTALPEQTLACSYADEVRPGYAETGEYPMPWHLINVRKYINPATERFIAITSYGCPGRCTFCSMENLHKYIPLPMDKVKGDIDSLMELYPFKECVFFDATLFAMPNRVAAITGLMEQHNLQWIADARATEIAKTDDSLIALCVNSGLKQLTMGLESGSPRVVDMMRKGKYHLQMFRLAAEKLSQFPLKMVSGVIFGCPGETVEDLKQTIDYIHKIKEINPNFFISTTFFRPLPNTLMSDMAAEYGYKQPATLEEWAELGAGNHYKYNVWQDVPWIMKPDEYKAIYDRFIAENGELLI